MTKKTYSYNSGFLQMMEPSSVNATSGKFGTQGSIRRKRRKIYFKGTVTQNICFPQKLVNMLVLISEITLIYQKKKKNLILR